MLLIFGSRHDFLISDFSPFSQSRLSDQYFFTHQDGGELIFYFSLAILDLGICLRLGHGRGICIINAFIIPRLRVAPTSVCVST